MFFQPQSPFAGFNESLLDARLDAGLKLAGDVAKTWQALAVELTDYAKRTVEHQTAVVEKLFSARTLEQAFEIQTSHVKRAYDDYVQQMTRINGIVADMTKHAMKPVEATLAARK